MKKNNAGFTLIELLVVVLIIGILSSIALPQYTKAVEKARTAEADVLMSSLIKGAKMYDLENPQCSTDSGTGHSVCRLGYSLPDVMAAGGMDTSVLTDNVWKTSNFNITATGGACLWGSCCGDFKAARLNGDYTLHYSVSGAKCCSGSNSSGESVCKGLGSGWSTGGGRDPVIGGEIVGPLN